MENSTRITADDADDRGEQLEIREFLRVCFLICSKPVAAESTWNSLMKKRAKTREQV
jgi:hypothetical protein